jgi:hypothetical protein
MLRTVQALPLRVEHYRVKSRKSVENKSAKFSPGFDDHGNSAVLCGRWRFLSAKTFKISPRIRRSACQSAPFGLNSVQRMVPVVEQACFLIATSMSALLAPSRVSRSRLCAALAW